TGVQTCALPICRRGSRQRSFVAGDQADPDRLCSPGEESGPENRRKLNIHAFDGRGTSQLRQETMRTGHMRFDDQRGMVLYSSLLILSLRSEEHTSELQS